ncbi:MAG: extracellular solute-binding protein [Clostridia bacterium]|nr:extracellular solute-binding protein [Clostridia bacterium]
MRDQYQMTNMDTSVDTVSDLLYYAELTEEYSAYPDYGGEPIVLTPLDITASSHPVDGLMQEYGTPTKTALLWGESLTWIEFTVQVPEDALYNLEFIYCAYNVSTLDAVRECYIDGEIPYKELSTIQFPWTWNDSAETSINAVGDEVASSQALIEQWEQRRVYDAEGYYVAPLCLRLKAGKHTLRFGYVQQSIALAQVSLVAPKTYASYADIQAEYEAKGYQEAQQPVYFEAEVTSGKNSPSLQRVADYDPRTSPLETGFRRLNIIGSGYWAAGGLSLSWNFTVPESGLYRIDMRVQNAQTGGLPVYRQIAIDGEVPFKELLAYRFDFNKDWYIETLGKEDVPYLFYFEAGVEHTLSMTVMAAEYTDLIVSLNYDSQKLTDYLLKVTMLTGSSPDLNYEYDILRNIPETPTVLRELVDSLSWKVDTLRQLAGGKNVSVANSLEQIISSLETSLNDPESIPKRLSALEENQIALSTWYTGLQTMPLSIDYFRLQDSNAPQDDATSRWYEKLWATLQTFFISFTKDYTNVGIQAVDEDGIPPLNVWASTSTEAAEILRGIMDDTFTPVNQVEVNLNLLPAGQLNAGAVNTLMLSMVSGRTPDVVLSVTPSTAVEMAIRDAALPLSSMKGFDTFSQQFLSEAFKPLSFNGEVYGIPERADFRLLYYRKDIFAALGLTPPETWEDFYHVTLQVLNQNQLEAYVPQDLSMFLFQQGGKYFSDNGLTCALDSTAGYDAFEELVELYVNYGVPFTTAFFNRFRTGSIPVGIGGYSEYISLLIGAPELSGKWGIALVPGHRDENNVVDRSWSGTVTSASLIMADTEMPEESWAFLQWWMGEETQSRYAREVESRIGLGSRVNTANLKAFQSLSWRTGDMDMFMEAWSSAVEIPGVLGGTYLMRHVNNAWNRIVVEQRDMTARDSLEEAIEEIDRELKAKQHEYPHLVDTGVNIYE